MVDGNSSFKEVKIKIGTKDTRIRWGIGRASLKDNVSTHTSDVVETSQQVSFRPARMGWLPGDPDNLKKEVLASPEELKEAIQIVKQIQGIARFGYQIHAYSLVRLSAASKENAGTFAGLVFPGTQTELYSITGSVKGLIDNWKTNIETVFPNKDLFSWFKNMFSISYEAEILGLVNKYNQNISIVRSSLKDKNGSVSVLGIPAIEAEFYGFPPYSVNSGGSSKSITFIQFDSPKSKARFEEQLLYYHEPLKLINAIQSVIFSPDSCPNLVGTNNSKGFQFVIKDGKPQTPFYKDAEMMLNDLAGLGFSMNLSAIRGGNDKPLIT